MAIDVKNALELKGGINGLKMILGAAIIVLGHEAAAVADLLKQWPDSAALHSASQYIAQASAYLSQLLLVLGKGTIAVGFLDKVRKFFGFGK